MMLVKSPATAIVLPPTLLDPAPNLYSPINTCESDTISPPDNSLLVVICGGSSTVGTLAFSSTTLANVGPWSYTTQVASVNAKIRIAWARITGSAGSGKVTFTGFGSPGTTRAVMHVLAVPNGVAVAQSNHGIITSATPSIALPSTPAPESLIIAAIAHNATATSPGASGNFTELAEDNGNRGMQTQYDAGSATDTADWSAGNVDHAMAIIEVIG